VAAAVLRGVGGTPGLLRATPAELAAYAGIGAVRATLVIAALELGRRAAAGRPIRGQRLAGASEVWTYFRGRLAPLSVEEFWAIGLDVRHRVQSESCLARGSLTGVEIHPRDVFRPLIRQGIAAVIFCHNHPPAIRALTRGRRADRAPARRRRSRRHSRARSRRRGVGGLRQPGRAELEIDQGYAATIPAVSRPRLGLGRPAAIALALLLPSARARAIDEFRARARSAWADTGRAFAVGDSGPMLNPSGMSLVKNFQVLEGSYGYSSRLSPIRCTPPWSTTRPASASPAASTTTITWPSPGGGVSGHGHEAGLALSVPVANRAALGGTGQVLQPVRQSTCPMARQRRDHVRRRGDRQPDTPAVGRGRRHQPAQPAQQQRDAGGRLRRGGDPDSRPGDRRRRLDAADAGQLHRTQGDETSWWVAT
jgi:hypothetical protein